MSLLLVALTAGAINLHNVDNLPKLTEEPDETKTLIISSFMHKHNGKLYLCGMARKYNRNDAGRFVFSLEADWRIYEPAPETGEVEDQFDTTYLEICEAD